MCNKIATRLLIPFLLIHNLLAAQQTPAITAQQIVDNAIEKAGGAAKLDTVNAGEFVSKIITPQGDTLSFAVKKKGFDKYFISALSNTYQNSTTIYNKGRAVVIKNDRVEQIIDPVNLEALKLQCYISTDYGYKKLGYKLTRTDDQKFNNFDCYVVVSTSPLGESRFNYYDKKTGRLIMIIYPNRNKTIFFDFYQANGIKIESGILMADTSGHVTQSILTKLNYDAALDDNWFAIPPQGLHVAPATFKQGTFKYLYTNAGVTVKRTADAQVETQGPSTSFKVTWLSNNDYLLYNDDSNPPDVKQKGYMQVRIIAWQGNRYYCHYITESKVGGTCVFEKIE